VSEIPLTLLGSESGGALNLGFAYAVDFYDEATIAGLLEELHLLLHQVALDPDAPL
jgi:hypothetical protein